MSTVSLSDLRTLLGRPAGEISMADAYGLDLTTGKPGGEVTLGDVKGVQIQHSVMQAFNPQVRGSVLGVYSVRLLNANYAGPAVSVKRASDGTTANFWPDYAGNLRDSNGGTYASWVGTSVGQVMTWYDQSGGGRHATAASGSAGLVPPQLMLDPAGSGKYVLFYPTEKLQDPDLVIRVNALNTTPGYNSVGGTEPAFVGASGAGGGGFVQFNPGAVSSSSPQTRVLNFGQKTFNIGTKGFSATCRFKFTGAVGAWERIFDFGNGSPNDNIILNRYSTSKSLQINYYQGTTTYYMLSTATFEQETLYNVAVVYNPAVGAHGTFYLYINGVLSQSSAPLSPGALVKATDRTLSNCLVGKSLTLVDAALNANIYSLRVYNRVLTLAEVQDASEYGVNYSGFTVGAQAMGAMMCNFYGIGNIHGWHTFVGSSGDVSLRSVASSLGQPYQINNTNGGDLMNGVGGFGILNGGYTAASPYVSYANGMWNSIAFSRASGTANILYLGMPDPALSFNGRAFHGYMTDLITFNAALPTSGAAGETTFSPEYKIFHKKSLDQLQQGMVGRYTVESWKGTQWRDTSGAGNHATQVVGSINKVASADRSGIGGNEYIFGGTSSSITFPNSILPATFTLFHVARYNGSARQRLFTHSTLNWLSGFWQGNSGGAYRGDRWISGGAPVNRHGDDWVLSTDQNNLYRSFGAQRSSGAAGSITTVSPLNLNAGINGEEYSDWACACVLVFDRHLSLSEYLSVEDYLASRYRLPIPIHEGLVLSLDATDHLAANGATWYDKTTNGYNFTLGNSSSWNNALTTYPFPYFSFTNTTMNHASRLVGGVRTDVPLPASAVKHATIVVFTLPISSTTDFRTLVRGKVDDHQIIINIGTNNLGMWNNTTADGATGFIPCDNNVDVTKLDGVYSRFNMWVFQLSSVAPYYRFFYNPSSLPLLPVGEIASNGAAVFNNGFVDVGGTGNVQHWGNIGSFAYYHRRLSDEELVNMYKRYRVKYGLPAEAGHYQMHSPYMWFRAEDLSVAGLAHGAGVSSWSCVGPVYSRVATGVAVGTGGLPVFHKTTEERPFVRLGTGVRSTANGNYFRCGALDMNIANKGGFTVVCSVRFRGAAGMWERVFEFGAMSVSGNVIQMTRNQTGSALYTGYYVGATQYSTVIDTAAAITGDWQTLAMRVTAEELTSFYGTTKYVTVHNGGLTNRSFVDTFIGRSFSGSDDYANIDIRDIMFYDRALTDEQIAEVRTYLDDRVSIPKAPATALSASWWNGVVTNGLQLWLDMSMPQSYDGSGSVLYDVSGNGRNFTLGGTGYTWSPAGYLRFSPTANAYADGPANSVFGITTDYTLEMVVQPYLNGTVGYINTLIWFAELGAVNNRLINVHLPWVDNNVYYDTRGIRAQYLTTTPNVQRHYVFRTRMTGGTTYAEIFENGVLKGGPTSGTASGTWGGLSRLFSDNGTGTSWWRGLFYYMRLYNRALTDAEIQQNYAASMSKYMLAQLKSVQLPNNYNPFMWYRADDLASIADGGAVSSWPSFLGSRPATGMASGGSGLPVMKRTETYPYVSLGTGSASTSVGNFFSCGAQTMNISTNGGFTMICSVRFRLSTFPGWERIIDFGNGENNNNLITARYGGSTNFGISYRNGTTASDHQTVAPINAGTWQTVAFRFTNNEAAVYYGTSSKNTYATMALQNKAFTVTYIGRSQWASDYFSNIDIRELMIYDKGLTDAEVETVRTYMTQKYA